MKVSRQDCCCTMGEAWGPHCELCPERNTDAYTEMCQGSGMTVDGNGKNTYQNSFVFYYNTIYKIIFREENTYFLQIGS